MKIGNILGKVLFGYFVIGGLIGLTQLGMTKLFEPSCDGTVVHTLWARHSAHPFLLVLGVAQWLPDLYQEVTTGNMTVRDYLLGGYKCVATRFSPDLSFVSSQYRHWAELGIPKGLPRLGSLAAEVLKGRKDAGRAADQTLVTIEPIAGVTLELPGDWLVVDPTAIQKQMTERNQTWGFPEVPQLHAFVPPGQVENVFVEVTSFPPILPGKELQNLHDPEVRAFVDGAIKGVTKEIEKKGFTFLTSIDLSEERVEKWAGFGFTFQMVSPSGATLEGRYTVIQTSKRTVLLNLGNSKAAPSKFGETLKHARVSLKITS